MKTQDGFQISHTGCVVEVYKAVTSTAFPEAVRRAHALLRFFKASQPGSTWGTDGIGYEIQRARGIVAIKKSGVGPTNFKRGCAALAVAEHEEWLEQVGKDEAYWSRHEESQAEIAD